MKAKIAALIASVALTTMPALAQVQADAQPAQEAKERAKAQKLKVGDRAPEFKVEKFLKGEPITGFEKGQVYVVEFWATWCGPCIAAMPHLSELQRHYKDDGVTFIGTNIWERYNDETEKKVAEFVEEQGDRMAYAVAYDGKNGHMTKAWMDAAGQNGIPAAFLVDKEGTIAWIGHPMMLDVVLPSAVKGETDPATLKARSDEFNKSVREAMQLGATDAKGAIAKLDAIEREYPSMADRFDQYRAAWLAKDGDAAGAKTIIARRIARAIENKNSGSLNEIAWMMVDPNGAVEPVDLDLALRAAEKADELTRHKEPMIIDTLARVYFERGEIDKAIELQSKAVSLIDDGEMKQEFEKVLESYKAKKD